MLTGHLVYKPMIATVNLSNVSKQLLSISISLKGIDEKCANNSEASVFIRKYCQTNLFPLQLKYELVSHPENACMTGKRRLYFSKSQCANEGK